MKEYNGKFANEVCNIKRNEAEERQRLSDLRSPQDRLQRLDTRFGVGLGAIKERARLNGLLEQNKVNA